MIAFVQGRVAEVGLSSVVIDVGGVGLEVSCAPATLAALREGAQATVPTSLVVREESLTLFGFSDEDEKSIFELVRRICAQGYTVLIVEQNIRQVLKVVGRAYLLDAGKIVQSGTSAELLASPDIQKAYLGL